MPSAICTLIISAILLLIPGCASTPNQGYAFDSGFDESIRTIAVPIFRNETTSRGLEVQLTEAVQKQLQQRTPWRLSSTDRADTTLVGVITGTQLSVLSDDPQTGLVQEQAVRITIRFEWRDNRSGEVLVARDGYSASAVFSPSRGVGDRLEMGQRNAIDELASDLVSDLRSSW
ncbi:MAG: LptE family protein [Phycisphaerales bacterium]|nr:LptE family protein [Phycisphaerales bacterium]